MSAGTTMGSHPKDLEGHVPRRSTGNHSLGPVLQHSLGNLGLLLSPSLGPLSARDLQ